MQTFCERPNERRVGTSPGLPEPGAERRPKDQDWPRRFRHMSNTLMALINSYLATNNFLWLVELLTENLFSVYTI